MKHFLHSYEALQVTHTILRTTTAFSVCIIFLLLGIPPALAQQKMDKHLCYFAGAIVNKPLGTGAEIGLMYDEPSYGLGPCSPVMGYNSPRVGIEFYAPNGGKIIVAPKIGYELEMILAGVRLNFIDYTDLRTHDFRLTPELGFTFFGLVDLFFGYDIPLTTTRLRSHTETKITLSINIDPKMK